ncbi:MAG: response regulator transcription factor [Acidobacteriaceae bacterium]|jgi:DNA-binding NarL/FixJ family response regulator
MRAMSETHKSSSRIRILLADDHAMVVEGLRALLENSYEIVGVAADGRAMLEVACKLHPDVIVVDVSMPSLNGLDAAERLKTLLPDVKLVFLTMQDNSNLAAAALRLGAVGYVLKHSAASELMTAISAVLEGKSYVTPKLRPENWAVREARAQQYSKELTARQREVLQLLAEGRGMKEIAAILEVSNRTIMYHKYHIMQEFNLKNNADIVLFAIKQHLIPACDIT